MNVVLQGHCNSHSHFVFLCIVLFSFRSAVILTHCSGIHVFVPASAKAGCLTRRELCYNSSTSSLSLPKFGVPRPEIASHPSVALKPSVPQPGLLPVVISVSPSKPFEYRNGLMKPSVGRPLDSRTSFRRLTKPAKVGDEQDVPSMRKSSPPTKTRKLTPWAETSGKAYVHHVNARHGVRGKILLRDHFCSKVS